MANMVYQHSVIACALTFYVVLHLDAFSIQDNVSSNGNVIHVHWGMAK